MRTLLTDDNVLRVSAAAAAMTGVHAAVFPDHFHDTHFALKTPKSVPHSRWMGVMMGAMAAQLMVPVMGGNEKSKKNALKVAAGTAAVCGVREALMMESNHERRNVGIAKMAATTALTGVCLYQALRKDKVV